MTVRGEDDMTMSGRILDIVGERLDRLMTVEGRPMSGGLPPGLVVPMYEACRRHHGGPLSTLAARSLVERVSYGDTVVIATGAGVPPNLPKGETDGPPGAAALASALSRGLGANVVIVSEEAHAGPVKACVDVVGSQPSSPRRMATESIPSDPSAGPQAVADMFHRLQPSAVVFVELDGPNEEGFFHGVRGDRRPSGTVANLHLLAGLARDAGALTVSIGDGGNEVGFGGVRSKLQAFHPNGFVVTSTATDVVVSAAISNWGAYAVVAGLAFALTDPDLLHDPEVERHLIEACVSAGARDGATSLSEPKVDGIDWTGHCGFVSLIGSIVTSSIGSSRPRRERRPAPAMART